MINREAIHKLVDVVLDIQEQGSHYANLEMSNFGYDISVNAQTDGYDAFNDCELCERFNLDDSEKYDEVMDFLNTLRAEKEEPQTGATVRDSDT